MVNTIVHLHRARDERNRIGEKISDNDQNIRKKEEQSTTDSQNDIYCDERVEIEYRVPSLKK